MQLPWSYAQFFWWWKFHLMTGVHFETGTISQTPYVMVEDVDKSALPRGYKVNEYVFNKKVLNFLHNMNLSFWSLKTSSLDNWYFSGKRTHHQSRNIFTMVFMEIYGMFCKQRWTSPIQWFLFENLEPWLFISYF